MVKLTMAEMLEDDMKKWKLPPGDTRSQWVRMDDARMSLCAQRQEPLWFKRESVLLGGNKRKAIPVLRPRQLESRVTKTTFIPEHIAQAIAEHLAADVWHPIDAVISHMSEEHAAPLKAGKNRAARVATMFDGADECLTNVGKLERQTLPGSHQGLSFRLSAGVLLTPPKN
jgi:hypothetical protein